MKKYDTITPEGSRDILFEECAHLRKMQSSLNELFKNASYKEIITPEIEFYDVFNAKSNYDAEQNMFKMIDGDGRILALRSDCTIPIARLAATKLKCHEMPLRIFYNQKVYKMNRSLTGKNNETLQMGIELVGGSSIHSDMEVISNAMNALSVCEVRDFRIEIGHVGFFKSLIENLAVTQKEGEEIRKLIQSKNYAALNTTLDAMKQTPTVNALRQLPALFGCEEIFDKTEPLLFDNHSREILRYLKEINSNIRQLGFNCEIVFDLAMVNSVDYYSGLVFKGYIDGAPEEVLSGGRYDDLISKFGTDLPAIGFAMDLNMIAKIHLRNSPELSPENRYLIFSGNNPHIVALKKFNEMVNSGTKCELSIGRDKNDAVEYAQKNKMKLLLINE